MNLQIHRRILIIINQILIIINKQAVTQRASFQVQIESPNTGIICNLYNMDEVEESHASASSVSGSGTAKAKKSPDVPKDSSSNNAAPSPTVLALPGLPPPIFSVLGIQSCFFPAVPISKDIRYLLTCHIDPLTIGSIAPMIVAVPTNAAAPAAPSRSNSPALSLFTLAPPSHRDISTPASKQRPPSTSQTTQNSSVRQIKSLSSEAQTNSTSASLTTIKWSLRVNCPSVLQAGLDRSREEHFNAVKQNWEKKDPGRAKRAKSTRDEYLQQAAALRTDSTFSLNPQEAEAALSSAQMLRSASALSYLSASSSASLAKEEKEYDPTTVVKRRPFVDPEHPYLAPDLKERAAKKNATMWTPEQRLAQELEQQQQMAQANLHIQVHISCHNPDNQP